MNKLRYTQIQLICILFHGKNTLNDAMLLLFFGVALLCLAATAVIPYADTVFPSLGLQKCAEDRGIIRSHSTLCSRRRKRLRAKERVR